LSAGHRSAHLVLSRAPTEGPFGLPELGDLDLVEDPKETGPAAAEAQAARNALRWSRAFATPGPLSPDKLQSNQCHQLLQMRHFFSKPPLNGSHLHARLQYLGTAEGMFSEEHFKVDNAPL